MAKTKANEREFQGQVAVWIHKEIECGAVVFQNATTDSGLYGLSRVKFPDILVTLDAACRQPFCAWELKTPTTSVRDRDLLKNACEKAKCLGAAYFVTWNMQSAIIWKTPASHKNIVTEEDKKIEYGPYPITTVDDLRVADKRHILQELCVQLLRDLGRLHQDEHIDLPMADTTVFVSMVAGASQELAGYLSKDIEQAIADKVFNKQLDAWAKKQGINKYDQEYRHTLAQQIAYRLIGKILFYISLRRNRLELPKMRLPTTNYKAAHQALRGFFQKALEIDYQAIFEPEITDRIELSKHAMQVLINLTEKLEHWSFELMPQDVIGNVFEQLIPQEARHTLGQYFTPDNLVDLVLSFCIRHEDDIVMDPTCGTGSFLIRAYQKLQTLKRKKHHQLLNQIWGFDIAGFPAELATINLYRQDFSDYLNFPRVQTQDFFDVRPGQTFEFPPPKITAQTGERIQIKIPAFDALVGNFPFIRQELIEKVEKGYKKKIESVIIDEWAKDYPAIIKNGETYLSKQADIFAYMYFHAAAHLKEGGRMGFITSNAWLDVAYGYELQRFFLSKFKLVAVCESRCEPWFEQSAVNTVFTILERCNDPKEIADNTVRFIKLKKPLAELFPGDPLTDAQRRWIAFSKFVDKVEGVGATGRTMAGGVCTRFERIESDCVYLPEMLSYEDDQVRIRIIKQRDLAGQVERAQKTVKWGMYLKAPDIYFKILKKCGHQFCTLNNVADIRFGIKTGINEFFYLTRDQIEHWGIEEEFLRPCITTTKEIENIQVDKAHLSTWLFNCQKDKSELKGTKALAYIKWGERQFTKADHIAYPEAPSVQGRKNWYSVPANEVNDFLMLRFRDKRHYTPINPDNCSVGDVVFVGAFHDKRYKDIGLAYLNSVLVALFMEISGRTNLGDGLLTTYGPEINELFVPKPNACSDITAVKAAFKKLKAQRILNFDQEVKKPARIRFEEAMFDALGLDKADYKEVCRAVEELIHERLTIPKARKTKKKMRIERDLDKLCDSIAAEVFAEGVRKFPDHFVKHWEQIECEDIVIPAGIVKLGDSFFGRQQLCDENGKEILDTATIEKGKFIVYAKKKDEHHVRVPVRKTILVKAVQDYEMYLEQLKEKVVRAFIDQCGDRILAENLTRKVFDEHNLPFL